MRALLWAVLAVGSLALASAGIDQRLFVTQAMADPRASFDFWVKTLGKAYATVQEYERRYSTWLDNLKYVHEHNSRGASHWLGMNEFADLSVEEYRERALGFDAGLLAKRQLQAPAGGFLYEDTVAPAEVDWRAEGAVGPVKNQLLCGSCWAFSTTGAVEGANAIATGELITLSEQMLVDCDTERDHGCHGGLMDFAFDFIIKNGGLDTEEDYPYTAEEGTCDPAKRDRHVVTIDDYQDVPANDEKALLKAVANQPVSVAIEADQRQFQLYAGGVFDAECGTALNHGVLIVGYGSHKNGTHDVPYWIVKNSWGAQWGDKGYIRMRRNVGEEGLCGIAMVASFPIKKSPNPPTPPPAPPTPTPPPGPEPVDCDDSTQCPAGNTCCCMREFFGFCFTWACCPLPEATCCDDHQHCCPSNLPVCDTVAGRCMAKEGMIEGSVPLSEKQPAQKKEGGGWFPFGRGRMTV